MNFAFRGICAAAAVSLFTASALASNVVPSNFNGYGTSVNGFQDFFTGSSASEFANYTEISGGSAVAAGSSGNFSLPGDGTLHINGGAGDPNKLLYNAATYSSTDQTVLAMIEVTGGSDSDGFRGGVGSISDDGTGQGINELFRQQGNGGDGGNNQGNHVNFLNDAIAWGNEVGGANSWTTNTYYWLKLTVTGSGATESGEIWPADGVTPESSAATGSWTAGGRSGLAGLVADSSGGNGTFQVNYLLIQADGLPSITAGVPEPASLGLISLGAIGLLARRRLA